MKHNKGFAPILIILAIVLLGGVTYAIVPKSVLKEFFEKGDKPTEQQFSDTIDSTVHLQDDRDLIGLKEYNATKQYAAGDTVVKNETIYQAKVLTRAQGQIEFTLNADQPVTFRWTPVPVVVKPGYTLVYRLKVWQLMQGQDGEQAMKTNKPIVTKDVIGATEATVSGIYTGPCKPPYLCDFVWSIEVLTQADGTAGTSESASTGGGASGSDGVR